MSSELIAESVVSALLGGIMLLLARLHWRMKRTGESIRQTFLLAGLGLGLILGAVFGVALTFLISHLGGVPPKGGLSMVVGGVIGVGGYAFGQAVERRYARRRATEEDDYLDPDPLDDGRVAGARGAKSGRRHR
jgi:integral membrane sensor domain MASE1